MKPAFVYLHVAKSAGASQPACLSYVYDKARVFCVVESHDWVSEKLPLKSAWATIHRLQEPAAKIAVTALS